MYGEVGGLSVGPGFVIGAFLSSGTSAEVMKNNEGRSFYVTAELRTVLKAQLTSLKGFSHDPA